MHNFTVNQKNIVASWKDTITEEEALEARQLGNGTTLNLGKLEHSLTDIKTFVQVCRNFLPNTLTADIPPTWSEFELFQGETSQFNPTTKSKGIKVSEFVTFWNMITPFTFAETVSKNLINLMLNDKYGSPTDVYTVHCFNAATLQPQQPICFEVEQTATTETGGDIQINVTDSSGGLEYSLDGTTYQSENTFTGLESGLITVYVRDSTSLVNSRTFNVTSQI